MHLLQTRNEMRSTKHIKFTFLTPRFKQNDGTLSSSVGINFHTILIKFKKREEDFEKKQNRKSCYRSYFETLEKLASDNFHIVFPFMSEYSVCGTILLPLVV